MKTSSPYRHALIVLCGEYSPLARSQPPRAELGEDALDLDGAFRSLKRWAGVVRSLGVPADNVHVVASPARRTLKLTEPARYLAEQLVIAQIDLRLPRLGFLPRAPEPAPPPVRPATAGELREAFAHFAKRLAKEGEQGIFVFVGRARAGERGPVLLGSDATAQGEGEVPVAELRAWLEESGAPPVVAFLGLDGVPGARAEKGRSRPSVVLRQGDVCLAVGNVPDLATLRPGWGDAVDSVRVVEGLLQSVGGSCGGAAGGGVTPLGLGVLAWRFAAPGFSPLVSSLNGVLPSGQPMGCALERGAPAPAPKGPTSIYQSSEPALGVSWPALSPASVDTRQVSPDTTFYRWDPSQPSSYPTPGSSLYPASDPAGLTNLLCWLFLITDDADGGAIRGYVRVWRPVGSPELTREDWRFLDAGSRFPGLFRVYAMTDVRLAAMNTWLDTHSASGNHTIADWEATWKYSWQHNWAGFDSGTTPLPALGANESWAKGFLQTAGYPTGGLALLLKHTVPTAPDGPKVWFATASADYVVVPGSTYLRFVSDPTSAGLTAAYKQTQI